MNKQLNRQGSTDNGLVWLMDDVLYAKEAQAILMTPSKPSAFIDEKHLLPMETAGFTIAPWGWMNLLPQNIQDKIDRVEVVGANAQFNWQVCYGLGPKLTKLVYSDNPKEQVIDEHGNVIGGKVVGRLEIHSGEVYDWCQRSDLSMYMQEVLTDLSHFGNAFPVLLVLRERELAEQK